MPTSLAGNSAPPGHCCPTPLFPLRLRAPPPSAWGLCARRRPHALALPWWARAAAGEVVEILSDSLTLSETPVPLKIARLFLASDILHNTSSGVRNASRYRRCAPAPAASPLTGRQPRLAHPPHTYCLLCS